MSTAYDIFYNPDGTYKTSAQYEAEMDWPSEPDDWRTGEPAGDHW